MQILGKSLEGDVAWAFVVGFRPVTWVFFIFYPPVVAYGLL